MEVIFEFLFGFFGELVLQLVGEILLEIGLHSLAEPFRKNPSPWLAAIAYVFRPYQVVRARQRYHVRETLETKQS